MLRFWKATLASTLVLGFGQTLVIDGARVYGWRVRMCDWMTLLQMDVLPPLVI